MPKTKTKTVKVTNVTRKLAEQENKKCNEEQKLEKKKLRFSKLIVLLVIAMILGFTAATLYVFAKVGSEPGVLIGAFFAFATGEL